MGPADAHLRRLDHLRRRAAHLTRLRRQHADNSVEMRRLWAKIRVAARKLLTEDQRPECLSQRQPPEQPEHLAALAQRCCGGASRLAARGAAVRGSCAFSRGLVWSGESSSGVRYMVATHQSTNGQHLQLSRHVVSRPGVENKDDRPGVPGHAVRLAKFVGRIA